MTSKGVKFVLGLEEKAKTDDSQLNIKKFLTSFKESRIGRNVIL